MLPSLETPNQIRIKNISEIEAGYYWYSANGVDYEPVKVDKGSDGERDVWFIGGELDIDIKHLEGAFYGPIEPSSAISVLRWSELEIYLKDK